MPSLTRREVGFSPEAVVSLCPELSLAMKVALLNRLDKSWRESEPFEVEIEIPIKEHPHNYVLTIAVDLTTQQVTIERRIGNERFVSCPDCHVASC